MKSGAHAGEAGTVREISGTGDHDIELEDGAFKTGDKVKAKYQSSRSYYPGTIITVNSYGTYDISYDDGDRDQSVERSHIRLGFVKAEELVSALAIDGYLIGCVYDVQEAAAAAARAATVSAAAYATVAALPLFQQAAAAAARAAAVATSAIAAARTAMAARESAERRLFQFLFMLSFWLFWQ